MISFLNFIYLFVFCRGEVWAICESQFSGAVFGSLFWKWPLKVLGSQHAILRMELEPSGYGQVPLPLYCLSSSLVVYVKNLLCLYFLYQGFSVVVNRMWKQQGIWFCSWRPLMVSHSEPISNQFLWLVWEGPLKGKGKGTRSRFGPALHPSS